MREKRELRKERPENIKIKQGGPTGSPIKVLKQFLNKMGLGCFKERVAEKGREMTHGSKGKEKKGGQVGETKKE